MTNTETEETKVYRVPECNLDDLKSKFAKLCKRADKIGQVPPQLITQKVERVLVVRKSESRTFDNDREWAADKPLPPDHMVVGERFYHHLIVSGSAPVIEGWELLGVVEHGDHEVGNVIRTVPGREVPVTYRQTAGWCDHCHTERRRNETFIIRHAETAEVKQIGRNCLADFCRDKDTADKLADWAQYLAWIDSWCTLAEDEGGWGRGGYTREKIGTQNLLAMTSRIIRHLGWLSRGKAREEADRGRYVTATADVVRDVFFNPKFFTRTLHSTKEEIALQDAAKAVEPEDEKLAEDTVGWVRAMRPNAAELGDYFHNLLVVLSDELVDRKHFGIACSAVAAYQREMGQLQKRTQGPQSQHVGTVGKRLDMTVTVENVRWFNGQYGVRTLITMKDEAGNIVITWTGEKDVKEGQKYAIRGTVKKHGDFNGTKQTELTRVKFEEAV